MSGPGNSEASLPRLAYVGEVPVESSYHGSALLYRLLQRYPADRLRVIEVMHESLLARRLQEVGYGFYKPGLFSLLSTRLHDVAEMAAAIFAPRMYADLERQWLGEFRPQAILTVAHNLGWMIAAAIAEKRRIPLHLIIHDDWPGFAWSEGPVNRIVGRRFTRHYRTAASRLCVSPYMAEEYESRYEVSGTVLYPSRAAAAAHFDEAPPPRPADRPFTVAFAGSLYTADYSRTLLALAGELGRVGGRLLLFGPFDRPQLARSGLGLDNVSCEGMVSSEELIHRLRAEADVLFAPMSFAPQDRQAMRLNFPSKLADYTRAGLPLLVAGPPDSSAVRWALANPDAAMVVQSNQPGSLAEAVSRLARDAGYCRLLAKGAIESGLKYFSHQAAEETLFAQLRMAHGTTRE